MARDDPRTTDPDGRVVVFDAGTRLHLALGITISGIPFDHHHYDERADVLYLTLTFPPEHLEADALEQLLAAA